MYLFYNSKLKSTFSAHFRQNKHMGDFPISHNQLYMNFCVVHKLSMLLILTHHFFNIRPFESSLHMLYDIHMWHSSFLLMRYFFPKQNPKSGFSSFSLAPANEKLHKEVIISLPFTHLSSNDLHIFNYAVTKKTTSIENNINKRQHQEATIGLDTVNRYWHRTEYRFVKYCIVSFWKLSIPFTVPEPKPRHVYWKCRTWYWLSVIK